MVKGTVETITIEEEMERSYLEYAMSVIIARALPDARDGLKPVHRRILHAMREGGYEATKPYRKCARIVGEVMGKYHPHGDAPVYDSMVRMAQEFSMRLMLIDSQGNFGSLDGDRPAAMRYTEARLSKAAEALLVDIDKDTVDFQPNYDGSLEEPRVLPARIPNLLINGGGGIAVGMATNIPPHNLGEVCALCRKLLDETNLSLEEIIDELPGPDFPTGALILGREAIKECYRKGKGSILLRARSTIEPMGGGRSLLLFTEIPYQTNKARTIERIAELVRDKKISGIAELRDESDRDGLRIAVEIKSNTNPELVRALIFKHTALQTSYSVQLLALDKGQPRVMNLQELLKAFLNFRDEVLQRRTSFLLNKAQKRLHLLFGLLVAVDEIERIVAVIRAAHNAEQARKDLMAAEWLTKPIEELLQKAIDNEDEREKQEQKKNPTQDSAQSLTQELAQGMLFTNEKKCRLSLAQCQAILELRLQRLVGLEKQKLYAEAEENLAQILEYKLLLASKKRRSQNIKNELLEAENQFNSPRRTEIIEQELSIDEDAETLVPSEEVVVTITRNGYVKRVASDTYRSQIRGGKGRAGMKVGSEDAILQTCFVNTRERLLFFTDRGKVYALSVADLPEASPQAGGKNLINLLQLENNERVTNLMPLPTSKIELEDNYIVLATASGAVRRNRLDDFADIMRNGKIAMKIPDGDALVGAIVCAKKDDLFLASQKGQAIRFSLSDLRVFASRESSGVRGISLDDGDKLVSIATIDAKKANTTTILTALASGYGKRTHIKEYRRTGRGGKGIKNMTLASEGDEVVASLLVSNDDLLNLYSTQGQFSRIPVDGVRLCGRATRGVRLFDLKDNEKLVALGKILANSDKQENDKQKNNEIDTNTTSTQFKQTTHRTSTQ